MQIHSYTVYLCVQPVGENVRSPRTTRSSHARPLRLDLTAVVTRQLARLLALSSKVVAICLEGRMKAFLAAQLGRACAGPLFLRPPARPPIAFQLPSTHAMD